ALDLSVVTPSLLAGSPDQLLAVAADLLIRGDTARGGGGLGLLEQTQPPAPPEPRVAARATAMRCMYYGLTGRLHQAGGEAAKARAIQEENQLTDDWNVAVPLIMLRVYAALEDTGAVDREAELALAIPEVTEAVRLVVVPGARALAWFEAGYLARAGELA